MVALGKQIPSVVRFVGRLRGGSQPFLAEADDGLLYVVKFRNNLQGPNVLFNESMGTELYRALHLSVPDWTPIFVPDSFIARNPECWIGTESNDLKPISGPCFGSRLVNPPLKEILPASWYGKIGNLRDFWLAWMVDICASHTDHRQVVFRHHGEFELDAYFIDHGHMFGGPKGEMRCHFVAPRYIDPRIYPEISSHCIAKLHRTIQRLDADRLRRTMDNLPQDWVSPSAKGQFTECLARLQDSRLLMRVLDTMLDWQHQHALRASTRDQRHAQALENVFVAESNRTRLPRKIAAHQVA